MRLHGNVNTDDASLDNTTNTNAVAGVFYELNLDNFSAHVSTCFTHRLMCLMLHG